MFKTCTRCSVEKPIEEYYKKSHFRKYPTSNAGYDSHCKTCVRLDRQDFLNKNPSARKQADRKQHLKRYNLTIDQYNQLFNKQNGCCAGCNRHQSEFNRNLVVDHDHITAEIRGLLCVSCNLILGYALDQTETLERLIKYLKPNNSVSADKSDEGNILSFERKSLAK